MNEFHQSTAPKLPPLSTLRAFEAAARLNSFSRAASEIHVTPSAVSHQIKALELFLAVPLFVRYGRRQVTLTREGGMFFEKVSSALASIADAVQALNRGVQNRLTVSVLPSFAARWLMPRIGRFVDAHPGLDLSIRSTTTHADFVRDDVDIAIRFGGGSWPNTRAELFMHDELFPVCSPQWLRKHKPRGPQNLGDWPLLESDPEGWERWFAAAGVAAPRKKSRLDLGDASLTLQAAIDGRGVALARRSIAGRDLASGSLIRLFAIAAPSQYSYYFVSPGKAPTSENVQAFRRWLLKEIDVDD